MASFIPRKGPSGRRVWQAHIRRRGYPAQVRTFDNKAEAEAWAATIESEIARGVFVSRAEAESTTLAEALDRYLTEVTPRKRRPQAEAGAIQRWKAQPLAQRILATIRGKDIAGYITRRQADGVGANTIRLELALLSHLFNTARTAWGMESLSNPVDLVKGQRPKLPRGRNRRLVGDEETRLQTAAAAYGGEIGFIITWAVETAMRREKITGMRWEHVNRQARLLEIPKPAPTEPGKPKPVPDFVPLSTRAIAVLDALPRDSKTDGPVWNMRPDSITQAFARVCKAAGIEGLTFHDLRHEAASRLGERGFSALEIAAITGHQTLQMVKRYTHLRAEDLVGRLG